MTATNKSLVIVLSSMSRRPTLERGAELFITDLVSGPKVWKLRILSDEINNKNEIQ